MFGRKDPASATGASIEEIPSREFPCPGDRILKSHDASGVTGGQLPEGFLEAEILERIEFFRILCFSHSRWRAIISRGLGFI